MRPEPTLIVLEEKSISVSSKFDIEICTPVVEENPGFVACPPPFTAKDARIGPSIPSCKNEGHEKPVRRIRVPYNRGHVSGIARLHGATGVFNARKRSVRNVAVVF